MGSVTIRGCDRLCPGRYPGAVVDHTNCTNPTFVHLLHITGKVSPASDMPLLASLWTTIFNNLTLNQVRMNSNKHLKCTPLSVSLRIGTTIAVQATDDLQNSQVQSFSFTVTIMSLSAHFDASLCLKEILFFVNHKAP